MRRKLEVTLTAVAEVDDDRWLSKDLAEALERYAREPHIVDGRPDAIRSITYCCGSQDAERTEVTVTHSYRQWSNGRLDSRHRMLWAPAWLRRLLGLDEPALAWLKKP